MNQVRNRLLDCVSDAKLTRYFYNSKDVADLEWSPNNKLLASAGFDSNIVIWDGITFGNCILFKYKEKLHVIKGHEGFVKGLTWDPVGKYLASQVMTILYLEFSLMINQ